jgi:hypothetical protein
MRLKEFEELEKELMAFVNVLRDKLDTAKSAVDRAKMLAQDAITDAVAAVAPALGPGPLEELEAAGQAIDSALGDAEDAIEEAQSDCYLNDFDFEEEGGTE